MGFFDKIKGAMNAITGGAARVTVEFQPQTTFPSEGLQVRVTATSTGAEVKCNGIYVDIQGVEQVRVRKGTTQDLQQDLSVNRTLYEQSFQIAGPCVLAANQTQQWEGRIQLPPNAQPSFDGELCDHGWGIRGRLDAFGNDPDSGYVPFRVGLKA